MLSAAPTARKSAATAQRRRTSAMIDRRLGEEASGEGGSADAGQAAHATAHPSSSRRAHFSGHDRTTTRALTIASRPHSRKLGPEYRLEMGKPRFEAGDLHGRANAAGDFDRVTE